MNVLSALDQLIFSLTEGPIWLTLLAKITFLVSLAWIVYFAIAKLNPRWRVLLWRTTVAGMLAVAFLDVSRFVSLPVEIQPKVASVVSPAVATDRTLEQDTQPETIALPAQNLTVSEIAKQGSFDFDRDDMQLKRHAATNASAPTAVVPVKGSTWAFPLCCVWLLGIAWKMFAQMAGRLRLNSIVSQSSEANAALVAQASATGDQIGIGKFSVRISDRIDSPMVCRTTFGKTLLIPDSIAQSATRHEMNAVLAHEFSHLFTRDLEWNSFIRLVATLLWPHPLLWFIPKVHARDCEYVADAASARFINDAQLYVRTLAKVALADSNIESPQLSLTTIPMARSSNIRNRLDRVRDTFSQLPLSRSRIALGTSGVLLLSAFVGAFQFVNAAPVIQKLSDVHEVLVRIVDDSGKSIEVAELEIKSYDTNLFSELDANVEREDGGIYRISFPKDYGAVTLLATSPDHVRIMSALRSNEISVMPAEHTIVLPKGTKMSGRVTDEHDNPIDNAKVSLLVRTNQNLKTYPFYYDYFVHTNAEGRWTSNAIPAQPGEIWMKFEHPDFISDEMFNETIQAAPIARLRSGTMIAVMKKGIQVVGSVADESGNPVAAEIYASSRGSSYGRKTTTNMGEFSFENCRPGELVLTVVASGFAPALKSIHVSDQQQRASFSLTPGKKIAIKVEDPNGNPIHRAGVNIGKWKGRKSLFSSQKNRLTNEDGIWEWNDAPGDAVTFSVFKKGFFSKNYFEVAGGDSDSEPHVVRLIRELVVSGKVTDASTGEPVSDFKVIPGIHWEDHEVITWDAGNGKYYYDGEYDFAFRYPRHGHSIKIEAPGYKTSESRKFNSEEGPVSLDFKLKSGGSLFGRVLTPDGKPAVNAKVYVALPNQMNEIFDGQVKGSKSLTSTNQSGRFSIAREQQKFKLLIAHDSGVMEVDGKDFQVGKKYTLMPWGRVEGTVYKGGRIAKNTKVSLSDADTMFFEEPGFNQGLSSACGRTDSEGKFEFEKLIPGRKVRVARAVESGEGDNYRMSFTDGVNVAIEAGITHQANIGGDGRRVAGRLIVPNKDLEFTWQFTYVKEAIPFPKPPAGFHQWSPEKQQQWKKEWEKSPAGIAFEKAQSQHFSFAVEKDGSFQVDDLPAGSYNLRATIAPPLKDRTYATGVDLGSVSHSFAVEGGDASSKPLDLGDITLNLHQRLKKGDPTPPLNFTTLDGKSVSLKDFRGKVVVVDFWATWCGSCLELVPRMEALNKRYKDRDDFVMVSINFHEDDKKLKAWLADHPAEWIHGKLDADHEATVADQFGFQGIPAVFVIDRNGKIAAANVRGREINQAVKTELE